MLYAITVHVRKFVDDTKYNFLKKIYIDMIPRINECIELDEEIFVVEEICYIPSEIAETAINLYCRNRV